MCPHCSLPLGSTRCWMNAECFHYCQWQSRKIRNKNLVKYEDPRSNLGDKWSGIECSWKTEAPTVCQMAPSGGSQPLCCEDIQSSSMWTGPYGEEPRQPSNNRHQLDSHLGSGLSSLRQAFRTGLPSCLLVLWLVTQPDWGSCVQRAIHFIDCIS